MRKALAYNDVLLVPQYSNVMSRSDVKINVKINNYNFNNPIIIANMRDLVNYTILEKSIESGSLVYMHRFCSIDEQINILKQVKQKYNHAFKYVGVSLGVKQEDYENLKKFFKLGVKHYVIDVAHGDHKLVIDFIIKIKERFKNNIILTAGNVATKEGAKRLWKAGADIVKSNVGSGCFAAGTRVLLSNATYKNIEDIIPGDRVINMHGNPVTVINAFSTGFKKVNKIKTNTSHLDTYVTPDHKFYMGDLSTSKVPLNDSYVEILNKKSKTIPKQSKIKWKEIGKSYKCVALSPRKIKFELNSSFKEEIKVGKKSNILEPNYNIGYIFGTFLGNECEFYHTDSKNSHIENITWYFGTNEMHIAEKLKTAIFNQFKQKVKIKRDENIITVKLYDKNLGNYFNNWVKQTNKQIPSHLIVNNNKYLQGLYDGLLNGSGSNDNAIISFHNSSTCNIELFNIINYILYGYFPNSSETEKTVDNLKNTDVENISQPYFSRTLKRPDWKLIDNHQIVKILNNESLPIEMEVFDITVDDDTHSFIANNMIVHNSICSTRIQTGNGVPTFTAIMDIAEAKKECENENPDRNYYFIADGGIRSPGDAVKALCFADMVMIGNLFAGSVDTPGKIIHINDQDFKEYHGSSTHKNKHIEGYKGLMHLKPKFVDIIEEICQGIRSGCSYQGVNNLIDLKDNPEFIQISNAGIIESGAHDIKL